MANSSARRSGVLSRRRSVSKLSHARGSTRMSATSHFRPSSGHLIVPPPPIRNQPRKMMTVNFIYSRSVESALKMSYNISASALGKKTPLPVLPTQQSEPPIEISNLDGIYGDFLIVRDIKSRNQKYIEKLQEEARLRREKELEIERERERLESTKRSESASSKKSTGHRRLSNAAVKHVISFTKSQLDSVRGRLKLPPINPGVMSRRRASYVPAALTRDSASPALPPALRAKSARSERNQPTQENCIEEEESEPEEWLQPSNQLSTAE